MNNQFTQQAEDMFSAAKEARIPENFQAFAEEGVTKSRETFAKMSDAAQDSAKAAEEVFLTAQAGAKALGEKIVHNTSVNAQAAFDAAESIARAKTLPEAARLQANFLQQQIAVATAQTKEIVDLSTKVARQTFETMNSASTKNFEQFKN
ncbi:MAG: phasin family protein [Alphaproteobacteria bacterium]|nr:phasin family protein [Alphaproteobacteria bacterium]